MCGLLVRFLMVGPMLVGVAQSADWSWQMPLPQGNALHGLWVKDAATAVAVGRASTVMRTANAGTQWSFDHYVADSETYLNDIVFLDIQTAIAVGGEDECNPGALLRSTDGGARWDQVHLDVDRYYDSVTFGDALVGWAVGYDAILRTQDGGVTWERSMGDAPRYQAFNCAYATDDSTVWIVGGSGLILKTADGGDHWVQQTSPVARNLSGAWFTDDRTGWVVGALGTILKTIDGGLNWLPQESQTTVALKATHFVDTMYGWASGDNGTILHTTDGGLSWEQQTSGVAEYLYDIRFFDRDTGWAVGYAGVLLRTEDEGETWTKQHEFGDLLTYFYDVDFVSRDMGYIAGGLGTVLKSIDGGMTWDRVSTGTASWFYALDFVDEMTGCVAGFWGKLLKTADGGDSWVEVPTDVGNRDLEALEFVNQFTGWAVGQDGAVITTSDGGDSWVLQESGTTEDLFGLCFVNEDTGWAVGGSSENGAIVLSTRDGGEHWTATTAVAPGDWVGEFYDVHFADSLSGWAAGYGIYRTTDGGAQWVEQFHEEGFIFTSLHFISPDTGCVIGNRGSLLVTVDGGVHWNMRATNTSSDLEKIVFIDSDIGWIVGEANTVLHTATGGGTPVREPWEPGGGGGPILLLSNYPEPSRGLTHIEFRLPVMADVELHVADIQGRFVQSVLRARRGAGIHCIQWNTGSLPAGTYFISLSAGDLNRVERCVVLE